MKKFYLMVAAMMSALTMSAQTYTAEFNTDEAEAINITAAGHYRVYNDYALQTAVPIVVSADIADTVYVDIQDINIKPTEQNSAMKIGENTVVVLNLIGEESESILAGKTEGCGIEVAGALVINGNETTSLTCTGSGRAAAIGTIKSTSVGGDITINGGVITAKAGSESAGIGASNAGKLGNITINGGQITARGDAYSSGIGGSYISKGTVTITINGGTVIARSGYYCKNASIGKGNGTHSGTVSVVINGGSIRALGEKGADDGAVLNPTNGTDEVKLFTYTLTGEEGVKVTEGHIKNYVLGKDYGINDVYTDEEGKLYFWLPESVGNKAEVEINGQKVSDGSTTPDPKKQIEVKVFADNTLNDWDLTKGVYFWVWTNDEDGAWVEGQKDGNWYGFAMETEKLSFVVNNGNTWGASGLQTENVNDVTESACYAINNTNSGKKAIEVVACDYVRPETGVEDLMMNGISVERTANGIRISGTANAIVGIADITGRMILNRSVSDNETIELANGMYIVHVSGAGSMKVILK
ncbi:MAG: hypothetical protein IJ650_00995 [Paludibacteraceae bacterium]|nr:hypothetical protein [Paludibacteraceae bacterium]